MANWESDKLSLWNTRTIKKELDPLRFLILTGRDSLCLDRSLLQSMIQICLESLIKSNRNLSTNPNHFMWMDDWRLVWHNDIYAHKSTFDRVCEETKLHTVSYSSFSFLFSIGRRDHFFFSRRRKDHCIMHEVYKVQINLRDTTTIVLESTR